MAEKEDHILHEVIVDVGSKRAKGNVDNRAMAAIQRRDPATLKMIADMAMDMQNAESDQDSDLPDIPSLPDLPTTDSSPTADSPPAASSSHNISHSNSLKFFNKNDNLALIAMYSERKDKFNNAKYKNKSLWAEITNELNLLNENERILSVSQVDGRWKTLVAAYRKHVNNQNKTGQNNKTFEYEEEMAEVFGERHDIPPVALVNSMEHSANEPELNNFVDPTNNFFVTSLQESSRRISRPKNYRKDPVSVEILIKLCGKHKESCDLLVL